MAMPKPIASYDLRGMSKLFSCIKRFYFAHWSQNSLWYRWRVTAATIITRDCFFVPIHIAAFSPMAPRTKWTQKIDSVFKFEFSVPRDPWLTTFSVGKSRPATKWLALFSRHLLRILFYRSSKKSEPMYLRSQLRINNKCYILFTTAPFIFTRRKCSDMNSAVGALLSKCRFSKWHMNSSSSKLHLNDLGMKHTHTHTNHNQSLQKCSRALLVVFESFTKWQIKRYCMPGQEKKNVKWIRILFRRVRSAAVHSAQCTLHTSVLDR